MGIAPASIPAEEPGSGLVRLGLGHILLEVIAGRHRAVRESRPERLHIERLNLHRGV